MQIYNQKKNKEFLNSRTFHSYTLTHTNSLTICSCNIWNNTTSSLPFGDTIVCTLGFVYCCFSYHFYFLSHFYFTLLCVAACHMHSHTYTLLAVFCFYTEPFCHCLNFTVYCGFVAAVGDVVVFIFLFSFFFFCLVAGNISISLLTFSNSSQH